MNGISHAGTGVLLVGALFLVMPHITPVVTLVSHADAIRGAIGGAAHYYARTVDIGRDDLGSIKREASYTPEDREVKFYYGTDDDGKLDGVMLFPTVNTQHGPLEIGLGLDAKGTIRKVVVTKATAETKPWVLEMVKSGFLASFTGLHAGDNVTSVLTPAARQKLGSMSEYAAEVATTAVARGLVLYQVLFAPHISELGHAGG